MIKARDSRTSLMDISSLGNIPRTDNFSHHLRHFPLADKAKIWKLVLIHTLDPNRPTTGGPESWL